MKIRHKLTGITFILTLLIAILFYFISIRNQNNHLEEIAVEHMKNIEASYYNLEERDSKILFSALEVIVQDSGLKAVYLEKNRDRLYDYNQKLFQNLKDRYGITHFYFILPDGHVFLRMHDKKNHGDLIKRTSFEKARTTGNPAQEIELGKTAFALRAVMPYFKGDKLIGYIELGEEIDHFLKILKGNTGNEFSIAAEKDYLDINTWKALRHSSGLKDNWDDMRDHVIVSSTTNEGIAAKCFIENNIGLIEKGETLLKQIEENNISYKCGGFGLTDSKGMHIGDILTALDITPHIMSAKNANKTIMLYAILLFLLTFLVSLIISNSITKPILSLTSVAMAVGKGDISQRAVISSNDEIGLLQRSFNDMLERRNKSENELQESESRYRSLIESTDDSIYLVDREYRYIFMNKNHIARMGFTEDNYIGRSYSEFHSEKEANWFMKNVDEVIATGNSVYHEHESLRDGKIFLQTLSPVIEPSGKLIAVTVISKDITELKKMEKKLQSMSITDELTGLLNRRGFYALADYHTKLADRNRTDIFILYIDLDGLKVINDNYGHHEGDQALISMSDILRKCFRDSDVIARIGGDEFVLFLAGTADDKIENTIVRLRESIKAHNDSSGKAYKLSASIGISCYNAGTPLSIDELLVQADQNMYMQKNNSHTAQ